MLNAYCQNVTLTEMSPVPFNNVTLVKGCTAVLSGDSTIQLNKCGVYMVSCNASASSAATIQLYKDGVAQAQAQATGTAPSFTTLVQVPQTNTCDPCTSPVRLQIMSVTAGTYTDAAVTVTKVV